MSTIVFPSCRRNLLPEFVIDPQVVEQITEQEISKLSFAEIQRLSEENSSFALRAEALVPMKQRHITVAQAGVFLDAPDLVSSEFLEHYAFELEKDPEDRQFSLYSQCVENVLGKAAKDKHMYEAALQAVSLSKISGLFQKIVNCNCSFLDDIDIEQTLLNFCRYKETYEDNLKSFLELYSLDKIPTQLLAKILTKVAHDKNGEFFSFLCTSSSLLRLKPQERKDVAIASLMLGEHPMCNYAFSLAGLGEFSEKNIYDGLIAAATTNNKKYFTILLNASKHLKSHKEIKKYAWLESPKLSEKSYFYLLNPYENDREISYEDLGRLIENSALSFREDVASFALNHPHFNAVDEFFLSEAFIKAAVAENISLLKQLFEMDRYGDIEESCVDQAFYVGVVEKRNRDILKLFYKNHILGSIKIEYAFQGLKTFGLLDDVEACRLFQAPEVLASFVETIPHAEILCALESFVEKDACYVVSCMLNSPLIAKLPFPVVQRLFDRALEKQKLATLREILNSSKAEELNVIAVFEAIKSQVDLKRLIFFDACAIELLRAMTHAFTFMPLLQKLAMIKKITNLAITEDRAAVLEQVFSMQEFWQLDQMYLDIIASYAAVHAKTSCVHVMIESSFFAKMSASIAKKIFEHALKNNQVDTFQKCITFATKNKAFYEWLFSKKVFNKIFRESVESFTDEAVEILLQCPGLFLLSQDLLETFFNKEGLSEKKKALLHKAFTDRN
jgi:hypothetical protein